MGGAGERLALAAFVTQAALAGGNAVGIRFSNRELAPMWSARLCGSHLLPRFSRPHGGAAPSVPAWTSVDGVGALRSVQLWRGLRLDLLRARTRTRWSWSDPACSGTPCHAAARRPLAARTGPGSSPGWHRVRARGGCVDLSFSVTDGSAADLSAC